MTRLNWTIRLSDTAEADYDEILRWTVKRFGVAQARSYATLLAETLGRLEQGPSIAGARPRHDIGASLHALHVGPQGRHIILFRTGASSGTIDVLRILHDAMDLARHLPQED